MSKVEAPPDLLCDRLRDRSRDLAADPALSAPPLPPFSDCPRAPALATAPSPPPACCPSPPLHPSKTCLLPSGEVVVETGRSAAGAPSLASPCCGIWPASMRRGAGSSVRLCSVLRPAPGALCLSCSCCASCSFCRCPSNCAPPAESRDRGKEEEAGGGLREGN